MTDKPISAPLAKLREITTQNVAAGNPVFIEQPPDWRPEAIRKVMPHKMRVHHDRCQAYRGGSCDCYYQHQERADAALASLARTVEALAALIRWRDGEQGDDEGTEEWANAQDVLGERALDQER